VWRHRGERFAGCCITERDRFGGGSVMVWGGICGGNHTRLVFVMEIGLGPVIVMKY